MFSAVLRQAGYTVMQEASPSPCMFSDEGTRDTCYSCPKYPEQETEE